MERSPEEILSIIERIRLDLSTKKKNSIYHNKLFVIGDGGNVLFKDSFITKMGLNKYIKAIVFRSLKERTNYIANLTPSGTVWGLLKTNKGSDLDSSTVPKDMVAMNFQFNTALFKHDNKMNESTSLIKKLLREGINEAEYVEHLYDRITDRLSKFTDEDVPPMVKSQVISNLDLIKNFKFPKNKDFAIYLGGVKQSDINTDSMYYKNYLRNLSNQSHSVGLDRKYYSIGKEDGFIGDSTGNEFWVIVRGDKAITFMLRKDVQNQDIEKNKQNLRVDFIINNLPKYMEDKLRTVTTNSGKYKTIKLKRGDIRYYPNTMELGDVNGKMFTNDEIFNLIDELPEQLQATFFEKLEQDENVN